jgi:Dolichyl-phosphate-mannose-protein mannosyltransferase
MIVERHQEVGGDNAGLRLTAVAALPWTILAFGALLRLVWYFDRGSLWLDEALLALNIVDRSPTELLERLDFGQGAPWGFLLAEKLSVSTFGVDELSLRFVPLLAALASLPVFWRVASFYVQGLALLLSLLLFALSPQVILYGAEAKQYAVDVLATLLALWLLHSARQLLDWRRAFAVGCGGAVLLWFSHTSMIVLGAGGATLGAAVLVRRHWSEVRRLALVGLMWAFSAGTFFLLAWPRLADPLDLAQSEEFDVPLPRDSLGDVVDLARKAGDVLETAFGLYGRPWSTLIVVTVALLALAGAAALARRDGLGAALIVAPFVATAVGVAADLYPISIRFVLFLAPLLVVLVAAGTAAGLEASTERRWRRRAIAGVAVVGATWLVAVAGVAAARVITRQPDQDIRPVLEELSAAWRRGDVLYLHAASQYAARFYAEVDGVNRSSAGHVLWPVLPAASTTGGAPALRSAPPVLVIGRSRSGGESTFVRDLASLDGRRRVWFVFSHVVRFEGRGLVGDLDRHLAALDAAGTRKTTIQHGIARALLYDLGG